jgi:hypothetical protein
MYSHLTQRGEAAEAFPPLSLSLGTLFKGRETFLDVTCRTGHEHSHLRTDLANYAGILKAMGRSETKIEMHLRALLAEYGLKLG